MKTVLHSLFALMLATSIGNAQETTGITISVTIDNVVNDEGKVMASLHDEASFMKNAGLQQAETEIKNGKATFTFNNVAPGTYAIMAMHDANNNKKMDIEMNGMPIESYGMSGNNMSMGPPIFNDASFTVADENLTFAIRF